MNARWSMQKVGGSIIAVGLVLSLVWHFGFAWWVNPEPLPSGGASCPELGLSGLDTTATLEGVATLDRDEIPLRDSTATDSL